MSSSESGGGLRGIMPLGDSDDEEQSGEWGAPRSPPPPAVLEFAVAGAAGPPLRVSSNAARGIGFQLWPAAHAAAEYAMSRHAQSPGAWRGVRVLELGAGCGLTGLVFAALGADVTLTDLEDVAEVRRHLRRCSTQELNSRVFLPPPGAAGGERGCQRGGGGRGRRFCTCCVAALGRCCACGSAAPARRRSI